MPTILEQRWLALPPFFDPEQGTVIREPEGSAPGFWVGAPSAIYDVDRARFYLYWCQRRPLAEGRGWRVAIAESSDGIHFEEIWHTTKDDFKNSSIERSCLVKTPEGRFRLYVGYVEMPRNRWRIDSLEAADPRGFDPAGRVPVIDPDDVDSEGVKDPVVLIVGGLYWMFVPYGPRGSVAPGSAEADLHGTGNVFTVPRIKHPSGLAVSSDGRRFRWLGDATIPGTGWDRQMARLSTVLYLRPVFHVFYDGRTGEGDIYEDRTGLRMSLDLRTFHKVSEAGSILRSAHGQGCLRYLEAVQRGRQVFYYYEYGRPDGAYELRMSVVNL